MTRAAIAQKLREIAARSPSVTDKATLTAAAAELLAAHARMSVSPHRLQAYFDAHHEQNPKSAQDAAKHFGVSRGIIQIVCRKFNIDRRMPKLTNKRFIKEIE